VRPACARPRTGGRLRAPQAQDSGKGGEGRRGGLGCSERRPRRFGRAARVTPPHPRCRRGVQISAAAWAQARGALSPRVELL
jgi:hypothetical protein